MRLNKNKLLVLISAVILSSCGSDNNNTSTFPGFDPNNPYGPGFAGGCARLEQPITFTGLAQIRQDYSSGAFEIRMGDGASGALPGYTTSGTTTTTNYSSVVVGNGAFSSVSPPLSNRIGAIALNNAAALYQNPYYYAGAGQNISGTFALSAQSVQEAYQRYFYNGTAVPNTGTGTVNNTTFCVQTLSTRLIVSNGQIYYAEVLLHMNNGQQIPVALSASYY